MRPHDHAGRRDRLREVLRRRELPAVVVTSPVNVHHLTGFRGTNGQLLVAADGAEALVTDHRYHERAAVECPDLELLLDRDWMARTIDFARQQAAGTVGFEAGHLTYTAARELIERLEAASLTASATDGLVEGLRVVKDDAEIDRLRRACAITVDALEETLAWVAPGRTERQVATLIERTMVDLGAEAPAFVSIVASGPNSAIPHHAPTDRVLTHGDLLKLDIGARVDGYHADLTRTVALGDPGEELREVHAHVVVAQQRGVEAAVAGATTGEVDAACRDHLASVGLADHFVHGTGHGVGLEIHEAPAVAKGASATLRPGTAITVEPGVYLPGRGGVRIEDTVVIRPEGPPERLTAAPHDLRVL